MKNRGITLVALVITIIIMLILAGVTIGLALSENGIIGKTLKAKERYNIAAYIDVLGIIGKDAETEGIEKRWNLKNYMDDYAEKIRNNEKFNGSTVSRMSNEINDTETEEKIIVVTKEKYIFEITEKGAEYLGKQGDEGLELPPELQEGDIKYTKILSDWTSEPVEVKIWTEKTNFILEYSLDGNRWKKYDDSVKLIAEDNNTKFYARLVNKVGQTSGDKLEIIVDNIDREKPEEFTAQGTGKIASIEAVGNAEDKEATDIDGKSGIDKYYFSVDNGETWLPEEGLKVEEGKESKYTIENLEREKEYKLITKAVDKAKNERVSKETEVTTTIETYTIKYDINGGTGNTPANQTKKYGDTIQITTDTPTRTGYTFQGWATTKAIADKGTVEYNSGANYNKDEDVTLYAVWKIITYTIQYDINGGTETTPEKQTKNYGETIKLSTDKPKSGYTFLGWATTKEIADKGTVEYNSGADYSANKSVTLYAVWKQTTTTVTATASGPCDTRTRYGYSNVIDTGGSPLKYRGTLTGFGATADQEYAWLQGSHDDGESKAWTQIGSQINVSARWGRPSANISGTGTGYKYYRFGVSTRSDYEMPGSTGANLTVTCEW